MHLNFGSKIAFSRNLRVIWMRWLVMGTVHVCWQTELYDICVSYEWT
jgi:hypothetical protein